MLDAALARDMFVAPRPVPRQVLIRAGKFLISRESGYLTLDGLSPALVHPGPVARACEPRGWSAGFRASIYRTAVLRQVLICAGIFQVFAKSEISM